MQNLLLWSVRQHILLFRARHSCVTWLLVSGSLSLSKVMWELFLGGYAPRFICVVRKDGIVLFFLAGVSVMYRCVCLAHFPFPRRWLLSLLLWLGYCADAAVSVDPRCL